MKIYNENGQLINHQNIEVVEQHLCQKHIKPEDKVLELGARYGSVSIITNKIVTDKSSHYVVEPDSTVWECLKTNMILNSCNFNILKGVISKKKICLQGNGYAKRSVIDTTYGKSQIELFDLPNIEFDTLIADCEGFLETFYNENKSLFKKLNKMILEFDEPKNCNYDYLLKEFSKLNFHIVEKINHHGLMYYVFIKPKIIEPKILICSLSDRPNLSKPMFDKLQQYCNRHNYKCVLEDKILDDSRAPSWSKIKLLQREMKSNPDYEYIVWIDDDILICDKDKKLEDFINQNPFDNLLLCKDIDISPSPFNCGFMIFKNNEESHKMCQTIWDMCKDKLEVFKHKPNWEQEIFRAYYYQLMIVNSFQTEIKIIPHRTLQSIHMTYQKGDFSLHLAGLPLEKRIDMRDQVLKFLK